MLSISPLAAYVEYMWRVAWTHICKYINPPGTTAVLIWGWEVLKAGEIMKGSRVCVSVRGWEACGAPPQIERRQERKWSGMSCQERGVTTSTRYSATWECRCGTAQELCPGIRVAWPYRLVEHGQWLVAHGDERLSTSTLARQLRLCFTERITSTRESQHRQT